ncbi:MAG: transporter [Gemmatimonadales bacterium]
MRPVLASCVLLLLASAAPAQRPDSLPPIDTDRPDFTDGVHTIARHHIQFETGYTYQEGRGADPGYSHSVPEMLVRFGVTSRVEVRMGENFLVQRAGGPNLPLVRGFDDIYLGTKVNALEQRGVWPALSFEFKVNIPTGSDAISAHRVLPGGALLLGWETAGPWSAGIEAFGTRTADNQTQAVGSLSVQYQAISRVQFYGEIFTLRPVDAGAEIHAAHYANAGVLVLLSNDMQVDGRVGAGLNQNADRYFVGFGFAVRR